MVSDGVRSNRVATDADALFWRVSWPNGRAGLVAATGVLGHDGVFRVVRVIPGPIYNLCKAHR